MMICLSNAPVLSKNPLAVPSSHSGSSSSSSSSLKPDLLFFANKKQQISTWKRKEFTVQSVYSERGGGSNSSSSSSSFFSGFILGGILAGTLGFLYAPQISTALAAGTNKKEIMRKLPNFIYDEEKALEKKRQLLTDKIQQLNSSIDNHLSLRLRPEDSPDEVPTIDEEELF